MTRILLVAPTCDGTDIGEAWVAFQWAARLGARHEVTVLTYHKRGRLTATAQLPGVRVVEWAEPAVLGRAERLNSLLKPGYAVFYLRARRWIRQALADGETFDVVHQPVPVAMRYPSPAAGLGIPLVFGPVGGGLQDPPGFRSDGDTAPWYVKLRALDRIRLRHDPLLRRTYEGAAVVLGIAPYVQENLAGLAVQRFEVMSETGLEALPERAPQTDPAITGAARPAQPLRLLYVGRLVRTKGARDIVRALALIPEADVVLDVVGDGPDRATCEALARELGQTSRVVFHGQVDHAGVADFYRRADVFAFPSYREPGGNVVFEAMGHGLPLIVCDRGGPGSAVDATCAMVLPVSTPEALARSIAAAITDLIAEPGRRAEMGRSARRRVAEVGLWESKVEQAERVFARVAGISPHHHREAQGG